jgi:hypothetical protein
VRLYCLRCDDLHKLRGSELERAIYTLQLMAERAERAIPPGPSVPSEVACLQWAADTSFDHPYRERVDYAVALRIGKGGGL